MIQPRHVSRPASTSDSGPPLALSAGRRWGLSTIALALLLGNALVALQPPQLMERGLFVPHPAFVRDAFLLPAMFGKWSPWNEDYVITGKRTQTGDVRDRGRWIRLPLEDHFPFRHAFTTMQIYVPRHAGGRGDEGQQEALAVLAEKIRANHNRRRPERPVSAVQIGSVVWPKDPRGYRAGKVQGRTWSRVWFSEETP